MNIDHFTIMLFGLFIKLMLGVLFFIFWLNDRRGAVWFAWWSATFLLGGLAALLFMLRGFGGDRGSIARRERQRLRIRVVGLETIVDQFTAMASLPVDTELAWLRANLSLYPRIEDLTETLLQLYLQRRISATWELSQALAGPLALTAGQLKHVQEALVVRRNRNMRDAALPLLAAGGAFVAIGALHLPGRSGLVSLFREAGYTVTPVE